MGDNIMKIKIHDLSNFTTYIANDIKDCKDDVDKSAYQEAIKGNECIQMGCIIAEPIGIIGCQN